MQRRMGIDREAGTTDLAITLDGRGGGGGGGGGGGDGVDGREGVRGKGPDADWMGRRVPRDATLVRGWGWGTECGRESVRATLVKVLCVTNTVLLFRH